MILDVYEIQKFFEVDENESIEFEFKVTEWYEMPTKKRGRGNIGDCFSGIRSN